MVLQVKLLNSLAFVSKTLKLIKIFKNTENQSILLKKILKNRRDDEVSLLNIQTLVCSS